jgi:hypothetical protein
MRARGVGQVVEHLLCKHETLSLNLSSTKKEKEKMVFAIHYIDLTTPLMGV